MEVLCLRWDGLWMHVVNCDGHPFADRSHEYTCSSTFWWIEIGAGTASEFEVGSSQCRVENETNANAGGVVSTLYPKLPADFFAAVQRALSHFSMHTDKEGRKKALCPTSPWSAMAEVSFTTICLKANQ